MTIPEGTDLLNLALIAERSGRFAEARILPRRAITLLGDTPGSAGATS